MVPQNWNLAIIDIKDCFFQIPLHPDNAPRFAFSVPTLNQEAPRKRYHWKSLPQGMKNSPSICQWYLSSLLSPVRAAAGEAIILQYMDDVLVCAPNDDLVSHALDLTINSLVAAGFKFQEEKIQRMPPWKYLDLQTGSNLLGRDLQVKLRIGVIPEDGKMTAKVLKLGQEDEEKINKEVWAGEGNRGGLNIDPISVTIEREDCPIHVRQYPISLEGREGLKPVIEGLIKDGTLEPCMSPHNTPILPVKKPDGSYRLVQDLREVNKRTRSRYPVVPNPYTLLSKVPPQHQWFSVVDLKDAFWACPLAKESRDIFAFEWEDPKTGRKQQLRWTKLPQGFTESPNLFGQALEKILQAFSTPPRIQIIQYVDDLLLSGEDEVEVREATIKLLNFLGEKGLRVSKGKLQFVEPEVKYLGHLIKGDNIKWTKEDDDKLEKLKLKLASIPALSLPSLEKPFHLYVNVEKGVAHGVLVREWGGVKRPVAYLSKMLDPVSHGWPVCIQAIATTAILVEESRKLTFGDSESTGLEKNWICRAVSRIYKRDSGNPIHLSTYRPSQRRKKPKTKQVSVSTQAVTEEKETKNKATMSVPTQAVTGEKETKGAISISTQTVTEAEQPKPVAVAPVQKKKSKSKSVRIVTDEDVAEPLHPAEETEPEIITRSLSLGELRDLRREFTRQTNESILTWLLRIWVAEANYTILDGSEAKQLGSLSQDVVIDQGIGRTQQTLSLWQ
ncbi:hypothetical protein DUI87_02808 [Hirundo rustica rustica]|uniref:ribonuclease H n=1 Tax=Hirundo rustica rustica TaxID=333673 RepID=A0A3M0LSE4_HIRRU|nr:hypothetical protein DUI87_02808 [Hirundo rustica rustica]